MCILRQQVTNQDLIDSIYEDELAPQYLKLPLRREPNFKGHISMNHISNQFNVSYTLS